MWWLVTWHTNTRRGPPGAIRRPSGCALRRAVIMYYLGDMSVAEIAALEGTTVNAIKQRLHRGRAALAEHLVEPRPEVGNA